MIKILSGSRSGSWFKSGFESGAGSKTFISNLDRNPAKNFGSLRNRIRNTGSRQRSWFEGNNSIFRKKQFFYKLPLPVPKQKLLLACPFFDWPADSFLPWWCQPKAGSTSPSIRPSGSSRRPPASPLPSQRHFRCRACTSTLWCPESVIRADTKFTQKKRILRNKL